MRLRNQSGLSGQSGGWKKLATEKRPGFPPPPTPHDARKRSLDPKDVRPRVRRAHRLTCALSRRRPRAKSRTASVRRAMAADNKAPVVIAEKTRPAAKVAAAVNAAMTVALVALPAFAEEAATATSSGRSLPSRGWWTSPCSESWDCWLCKGTRRLRRPRLGQGGQRVARRRSESPFLPAMEEPSSYVITLRSSPFVLALSSNAGVCTIVRTG